MDPDALKGRLQEVYDQYEWDLATYGWAFEADRWAELVFCLLNQISSQELERTRITVNTLQDLGVLQIETLAASSEGNKEASVTLTYVLKQNGFSIEEAQRAGQLLKHVAQVIQRDYWGKIQRFLRRHGEATRDELVGLFRSDALGEPELRYAVSHWLQNAMSLPISLESSAVRKFCEDNGVSLEDLWQAADELDFNLALVDDLIEMHQVAAESEREEAESAEGGRKERES